MKQIYSILVGLLISTSIFAQQSVNNYKYIIVPTKFDFLKSNDQYQTSSLTKFLFNKHGYTAFLDTEDMPADYSNNRCSALKAVVLDDSGMLSIGNIIELRDCNNKVIFTSEKGTSKLKDYKKGYHEAIRNAFKSVQKLNYKYQPKLSKAVSKPVDVRGYKDVPQVKVPKDDMVKEVAKLKEVVLYAQPITNGFQVVNTKPEVVFKALKTSVKDVFILENKKGVLFKNGPVWIAEFYEGNTLVQKEYTIKF